MGMTDRDYQKLVRARAKPSPTGKNLVWAFCVGGSICAAGQGLLELYRSLGLDRDQAGTAVSITLILAAAVLHERLTARSAVGAVLITAGTLMMVL